MNSSRATNCAAIVDSCARNDKFARQKTVRQTKTGLQFSTSRHIDFLLSRGGPFPALLSGIAIKKPPASRLAASHTSRTSLTSRTPQDK